MIKLKNLTYRGRKAEIYDGKRERKARWQEESRLAGEMLSGVKEVLDVPFGTGRMLKTYHKLKINYAGIDSSEEMLRQAYKKGARKNSLVIADIFDANKRPPAVECVVCIRFLHLLEESNMLEALQIICSLAKSRVVLTIQLGKRYIAGAHEVATHDEKKFRAAVKRSGWHVVRREQISRLGWCVVQLERGSR